MPPTEPEETGREACILVAEDDENDIWLLKRAFHQAQIEYPLTVVRNGAEAIAYLQGDAPFGDRQAHPPPSLLLVDIKMPGVNGFELLSWVREQAELNRLPVVMLTASQESTDINLAYALGANSYLVKPATYSGLVDMVRRLKEYFTFTGESEEVSWL